MRSFSAVAIAAIALTKMPKKSMRANQMCQNLMLGE